MIVIRDFIEPGGRARTTTTVVCLHRISRAADDCPELGVRPIPDAELTGPSVVRWFKDTREFRPGSYTGGKMPYALVVRVDGSVDQCRPLGIVTPHALGWSQNALGIAIVGDFRKEPPTEAQVHTCEQLCGVLMAFYGAALHGHDELPRSSLDEGKVCPGHLFPLAAVRAEALRIGSSMSRREAATVIGDWGLQ